MTPELLAEIEAAAKRATPGPWHRNGPGIDIGDIHDGQGQTIYLEKVADARYIALCSPASISALTTEMRRMEAEIRILKGEQDDESCEGCQQPATKYDINGVPLCQECWEDLPPAEEQPDLAVAIGFRDAHIDELREGWRKSEAENARLREALELTTSALVKLRDEVKQVPAMNNRKYDVLGIAVNHAINRARAALGGTPEGETK